MLRMPPLPVAGDAQVDAQALAPQCHAWELVGKCSGWRQLRTEPTGNSMMDPAADVPAHPPRAPKSAQTARTGLEAGHSARGPPGFAWPSSSDPRAPTAQAPAAVPAAAQLGDDGTSRLPAVVRQFRYPLPLYDRHPCQRTCLPLHQSVTPPCLSSPHQNCYRRGGIDYTIPKWV